MVKQVKPLKLPSTIKVGYRLYTVQQVTSFGSTTQMGECSTIPPQIQWRDTGNAPENANTILHESLHACFNTFGLCESFSSSQEEQLVNTMANALCGLIKDNPELINYLQEKLT